MILKSTRREEGGEVALVVFDRVHARRGHGPAPEWSRRIQRDGGTMRHLTFKDRVVEEVQGAFIIEVRPPAFFQFEPALYG